MESSSLICRVCKGKINLTGDYINSPVLLNSVWKKCLGHFNLQNIQEKIYLCDHCMSIALGRKIDIRDLKECALSINWLCDL